MHTVFENGVERCRGTFWNVLQYAIDAFNLEPPEVAALIGSGTLVFEDGLGRCELVWRSQ